MITIRVPKKIKRQRPTNPVALGWHIMRQRPASISGQSGSGVLYGLCCKLVRAGLEEKAIWPIIRAYNDTKCDPPWSDDELQHKIDDALIHACEDQAVASARREQVRAAAQARAPKPVNEAFLEDDGRGNMIPKGPGKVVPLHTLPPDHPAQVYLHSRGFLAKDLRIQFRCDYCEEERSDVYYKRLDGGFRATPQGRIIFYIDVNGVNVGWQARVLDLDVKDEDGQTYRWIFHPYTKDWVRVLQKDATGRFSPLPGYEGWELPKYIIGAGCRRNASLMGYDEAVRWNSRFRAKLPRVCILAEGPLDAGRVGPPGIAMLGKFLSKDQAALLNARFDVVIFVADNDAAGQEAKAKVFSALHEHPGVTLHLLDVPAAVKDLGEMTRPAARALVQTVCPIWRGESGYI